jgi:hypothetical protein
MGRAACRATTGRLLHVPGRAAQRAGAVAQARPVGSCRARDDPWFFGPGQILRAGSNFACHVLAHLAWPESTGLSLSEYVNIIRIRIIIVFVVIVITF